ncbi:MAG: hypothetical protein COV48_11550 [Elusimicrobia bacterium CG11_big_fil_rev_8_21_14_0_20_64_6]|nr:MAG: hypothetical protein COV48_11550 [Elusimicrobia bacterium CG11_big_fil_rev_8_21_14_0_20_64_6]
MLAVVFAMNLLGDGPKGEPIAKLLPAYSDNATVRKVRKEMTFDGAPCQSCHDGVDPIQGDPKGKGVFHEAIKIQHGRNQHCFNCHNRKQPADFANFDGSPIKLADVQMLCAKCHGTTYRDWNDGVHGKRTGFWDVSKGGPKPTVCIACHDPHWPIFKPLTAAPAPHVNPRGPAKSAHRAGAEEHGGHE